MNEFTGTYWKCNECDYLWDYNDDCPECGSRDLKDVNIHNEYKYLNEVKIELEKEIIRVAIMISEHN